MSSTHASKEDEMALQEALASCSTSLSSISDPTAGKAGKKNEKTKTKKTDAGKTSSQPDEQVVSYKDGATPLFLSIEGCRWEESLELVLDSPSMCRVYVKSSGTEEHTTFGWSVWKRLPLHEACRRRPPAWLVAALLEAYPEASALTTHYGELPLHLAVEMGASPEVINLLLIHHLTAVFRTDHSGRLPEEVLGMEEQGMATGHVDGDANGDSNTITITTATTEQDETTRETNRVIQTSLREVRKCLSKIQDQQEKDVMQLQQKHREQLASMKSRYTERISLEKATHKVVAEELDTLKQELLAAEREKSGLLETVARHDDETRRFQAGTESRDKTIEELTASLQQERQENASLRMALKERHEELDEAHRYSETLEEDLGNVTRFQHRTIEASLRKVQKDFGRLAKSHQALEGLLSGQSKGLQMLLEQRGIDIDQEGDVVHQEEKSSKAPSPSQHQEEVGEMNASEVANAASQALAETPAELRG